MARSAIRVEPETIRWIDPPHAGSRWSFGTHRFVALGHSSGESNDVWLGKARLTPEGHFIQLSSLYNLSDTSAADEAALRVSHERIAWTVTIEGEVASVQVVDMKGQVLASDSDMTALERWQTRLTFLQETGQLSGLCRRGYRFDRPQHDVELAWSDEGLQVRADGARGVLHCDRASIELGIAAEPSAMASPGDLITWAVDRVRALPWFGSDRMQWVKAITFNVLDRFAAARQRVVGSDGIEQLNHDVGESWSMQTARPSDPDTGWPPVPMQPILAPALKGEGEFRPLDSDPFAIPPRGGPSPFAVAFLRPDPSRPDSQIFVVVWDPRLIELHTMTGTREPKTATGETGSGTVPRDNNTLPHFAAAFNGGFQATHGEFGMMAEQVVYLPPKPYAATIAELSDGTTGMGTWPDDEAIPETIVGFRQNLTPLVVDGAVNPYRRTWWGGVPPGWQDATRTVRTGLCQTRDQFVAYFYGASIGADHLAKAMQTARCDYGVHLDMNPGHTGFEFYRIARTGTLPQIQRKLESSWETRGTVSGTSGWEFLGRRLLRTMHLMHFPRYIRTDSRDFFYLTHRSILPPATGLGPATGGTAKSEDWKVRELEQRGFPPALATRKLHPDSGRPNLEVTLVVLDAKWLTACRTNCNENARLMRFGGTSARNGIGIYQHARRFIATTTPPPDSIPIAFGRSETDAPRAVAALGIAHGDWLYYAEVTRNGDRVRDVTLLKRVLQDHGAETRVYLDQILEVEIGSSNHAANHPGELAFFRDGTPMTTRLFRDTAVVPPAMWQPLQAKRVRYIRHRGPTEAPSASAAPTSVEAPPSSGAEEAP